MAFDAEETGRNESLRLDGATAIHRIGLGRRLESVGDKMRLNSLVDALCSHGLFGMLVMVAYTDVRLGAEVEHRLTGAMKKITLLRKLIIIVKKKALKSPMQILFQGKEWVHCTSCRVWNHIKCISGLSVVYASMDCDRK
ncbi:hypothetical protein WA026_016662 [Henosepilachna vigintioctopunctata]|uniref:Uncharacterized protein n=1 Tax=Henosepilachna vigintioctopunctata TaxID=420089 RepID=A0AAW1UV61_9CUCU